jgi:hypothetical protein
MTGDAKADETRESTGLGAPRCRNCSAAAPQHLYSKLTGLRIRFSLEIDLER